jgi:NAD(P)-dependent dehydrogenase (short-subunit alcohol dehydrogenase family)
VTSLLLATPVALARRMVAHVPLLPVRRASPLQGRRVLVTGASSGIGEATALAVAARGGRVLLAARRVDELDRVAAVIRSADGEAWTHPCDLTDDAAVKALVQDVLAEHGGVDMIVNNAGRSIRRSLAASYDRMHDFERTMEINYFAPLRLMLGLLPSMVEQGHGHVVNVLSWGVQVKAPKFTAYLASKTALDVFSRIAGRELYADGVTFTNVRMPLVRTEMIGPTEVYGKARALSPEQAAQRIVRALEDRPLTIDTAVGRFAELFNLAAPRLSDAVVHHVSRRFPDSRAATEHLS